MNDKSKNKKGKWWPLPLTIVIIITLWASTIFFLPHFFDEQETKPGGFGDSFGAINALFSGFAFLGVIYAIILQKQELRAQREELELTRKELKRTAGAQERSEKALQEQVESMKKTAELNGLNSILQYLGSSLVAATTGKYHDADERDKIKEEAGVIKQKIEEEINFRP